MYTFGEKERERKIAVKNHPKIARKKTFQVQNNYEKKERENTSIK